MNNKAPTLAQVAELVAGLVDTSRCAFIRRQRAGIFAKRLMVPFLRMKFTYSIK